MAATENAELRAMTSCSGGGQGLTPRNSQKAAKQLIAEPIAGNAPRACFSRFACALSWQNLSARVEAYRESRMAFILAMGPVLG